MTPILADLARRLDAIADTAPYDPATEAWAGSWIREVTSRHLAAETFWHQLGEPGQPLLALAEALIQPDRFPDDRQADALSFYRGAARAALGEVQRQAPGSHPRRVWHTQAEILLAEAEAAARRLRLTTASARKRTGAQKTNARFDPARSLAVEIATDRWAEWQATRQGYCPRISDAVKEVHRVLAADPRALGLETAPDWDTIRKWLKADCTIPPEARQSGQRKRLK
jgi:hypothetical protein